jgi:hypothetical protein
MRTIVLKPMRTIVLMFGAIMRTNVLKCPQFFSSEFSISFNREICGQWVSARPIAGSGGSDGTELAIGPASHGRPRLGAKLNDVEGRRNASPPSQSRDELSVDPALNGVFLFNSYRFRNWSWGHSHAWICS